METVFHELVKQKNAVETSVFPFDRVFHTIEKVNEIGYLLDVQIVLIVTMLKQLYRSA